MSGGPFRFGVQVSSLDPATLLAHVVRAEAAGFDVVLMSDHVGNEPSPLPALAAVATATSTIRVGTLVLNGDMRNPVQLAWEAATLDLLSGGRFELGLGAGHTPQEYAATGIALDAPAVRKARLMETVEVVRALLDGHEVTHHGQHHHIEGARVPRSVQDRLPILVGGNGDALLAHAARHADIIGLQGLGRTRSDGHSHEVRWDPAWLDEQVAHVKASAGDRVDEIELSALVQIVTITDDRDAAVSDICQHLPGLPVEHASDTPYLAIGTHDQIVEQFVEARERWGISYFQVRDIDAIAPVIERLRTADVVSGT
ncbi:LLM class F420-dependent oxidoreductase [soil metagenome]